MSSNEEDLRTALRKYAVRLDTRYGRIRCDQCGGLWVPGTPENHTTGGECLASPPPVTGPRFAGPDENLRAMLTAWEISWPTPDPAEERAPKERCSKIVKLSRHAQYQEHYNPFPPSPPERTVIADAEEDFLIGDGGPLEDHTRTLSDEEWAVALAAYEKARKEHERCGGHYRQKTGPDIVDATFILENGGHANARWVGTAWMFLDWSSEPLK